MGERSVVLGGCRASLSADVHQPQPLQSSSPSSVALPCSGLHGPGGPLPQLLGRLLALGAKSWRIQNVASLQVLHSTAAVW